MSDDLIERLKAALKRLERRCPKGDTLLMSIDAPVTIALSPDQVRELITRLEAAEARGDQYAGAFIAAVSRHDELEARADRLAAENERLTKERDEAVASALKWNSRYEAAEENLKVQSQQWWDALAAKDEASARADRLAGLVKEAGVLLSSAPVSPECDWKCGENYARGPCDCGIRQWEDEKDALLPKLKDTTNE